MSKHFRMQVMHCNWFCLMTTNDHLNDHLTSTYLVIYSYIYIHLQFPLGDAKEIPLFYKTHILMFVGWLKSLTPLRMVSSFVGKSRFRIESFKTQQIPLWVLPTLEAYHVRGWITLWQYHYSSLINSPLVHHGA